MATYKQHNTPYTNWTNKVYTNLDLSNFGMTLWNIVNFGLYVRYVNPKMYGVNMYII